MVLKIIYFAPKAKGLYDDFDFYFKKNGLKTYNRARLVLFKRMRTKLKISDIKLNLGLLAL